MGLFDFIRKHFYQGRKGTGLELDDPALLEPLPRHELFAGGAVSKDWRPYCPPFRYQGSSYWCTGFAGTAIGSIFDKIERGGTTAFSPLELFYRAGGQVFGNYLLTTAQAMKEGYVLEKDLSTPIPTRWGTDVWKYWANRATATKEARDFGRQFRLKDHAVVKTDSASLRQALASSPLSVAIGIGRGYWDDPAPRQAAYSAYHNVVLVHMEEDGTYWVFDSLTATQGFTGFHKLASDYEILTALSFIDLPNDWKELQEQEVKMKYPDALSHYGKPRVLAEEQRKAQIFSMILKSHPTLQSIAGRYWTSLINALTYGDYGYQDILNHLTSIRRTGKKIFDLNKLRSDQ